MIAPLEYRLKELGRGRFSDRNATQIPDGAARDSLNLLHNKGRIRARTRQAIDRSNHAAPATPGNGCLGWYELTRSDGTSALLAKIGTSLYATTASGGYSLGNAINTGSPEVGALHATHQTQFATFGDRAFLADKTGYLIVTNGSSAETFYVNASQSGTLGLASSGTATGNAAATISYWWTEVEPTTGMESPPSAAVTVARGANAGVNLTFTSYSTSTGRTRKKIYRNKAGDAQPYFVATLNSPTLTYSDTSIDTALTTVSTVHDAAGVASIENPAAPQHVCVWKGRVVIANFSGRPSGIRWSRLFAGTQYENFSWSNRDINPNDGDEITGLVPFQNVLVIFKRRSIWIMTGDSNDKHFAITPAPGSGGIGARAARSIVATENVIYFLTESTGVYAFDLGNPPARVGAPIDGDILTAVSSGSTPPTPAAAPTAPAVVTPAAFLNLQVPTMTIGTHGFKISYYSSATGAESSLSSATSYQVGLVVGLGTGYFVKITGSLSGIVGYDSIRVYMTAAGGSTYYRHGTYAIGASQYNTGVPSFQQTDYDYYDLTGSSYTVRTSIPDSVLTTLPVAPTTTVTDDSIAGYCAGYNRIDRLYLLSIVPAGGTHNTATHVLNIDTGAWGRFEYGMGKIVPSCYGEAKNASGVKKLFVGDLSGYFYEFNATTGADGVSSGTKTATVTSTSVSTGTLADTAYAVEVAADSPIGEWKLNDTATSGGAAIATVGSNGVFTINPHLWTSGVTSPFTNLTVISSAGTIATAPSMSVNSGIPSFTTASIEIWVKSTSPDNGTGLLASIAGWTGDSGHQQGLRINVLAGIMYVNEVSTGIAINDGTWKHLVATINNTTGAYTAYVNGVLVSSGTAATFTPSGAQGFVVGSSVNNFHYPADYCYATIYNTILPANRVLSHYYAAGTLKTECSSAAFYTTSDGLKGLPFTVKRASDSSYETQTITSNTATGVAVAGWTGAAPVVGDLVWVGAIQATLSLNRSDLGSMRYKFVQRVFAEWEKQAHSTPLQVGFAVDGDTPPTVTYERVMDGGYRGSAPVNRRCVGVSMYFNIVGTDATFELIGVSLQYRHLDRSLPTR